MYIFCCIFHCQFNFFKSGDRGFFKRGSRELYWFLFGNAVYYVLGILLAVLLKDNRAFCKYVCPIAVFLKVGAKYSLLKIEKDPEKYIDCRICEQKCPMQIKLMDYKNRGQRIMSTECIFCNTCTNVCPVNAISPTFGLDRGLTGKEKGVK